MPREPWFTSAHQLVQTMSQNAGWAEAHAVLDRLEKEAVTELQVDLT